MKSISSLLLALKSGQGLRGQLLRGGIGSIGIKVASTGLNFVLAIVLARLLGADGFGVYSFVFAIVSILAVPAQLGLPNLIVRETAKAQAAERWDVMKTLWRWSTTIAVVLSAALVILGAGVGVALAAQFTPLHASTFAWGLLLIPLLAIGNLRSAALRGLRHVVQGQLPEFILRPLFLLALLAALMWWQYPTPPSASTAMMLCALAAALSFVAGIVLLVWNTPQGVRDAVRATVDMRPWLAAALPLAMMEGMLALNDNIGLLVFGLVGSDEDVGNLKVALQLSSFVTFGYLAVNVVVAPFIARLHVEGAHRSLGHLALRAAQASTGFGIPVAAIFVFGGQQLVDVLFGSGYQSAGTVLLILTLGQLANVFTGSAAALLYMTGHEVDVAKIIGLACVINVALTLALEVMLGINGVALAAAISVAFWNIAMSIRVKQLLNINSTVFARP